MTLQDESEERRELLLDRALRLFDFLARLQQLRTPSIRTAHQYQDQGGKLIWLHQVPLHSAAASAHRVAAPAADQPFLVVDRVPRAEIPRPPAEIGRWIDSEAARDYSEEPQLKESLVEVGFDAEGESTTTVHYRDDNPELTEPYSRWLRLWRTWAESERANEPVRELYSTLFRISEQVASAPEEFESVIGVGCLSWKPDGHETVKRHLLSTPVEILFDDKSGRITVQHAPEALGVSIELDMLDPVRWPEKSRLDEIKVQASDYSGHALDRDEAELLLVRLVNGLDPEGQYLADDIPVEPRDQATVTFAPALVIRKRSNRSLLRVFQEIRAQIAASGSVPIGVQQLIDIYEPGEGMPEGAREPDFRFSDSQTYLPLPANEEQFRIVERVDSRLHTVVQGPPGTGKTHTIANLLSHLLARGLRVLVTAHTDRALRELRAKLPDALEPLCVSVVGQDRADIADLKVAVNTIASNAAEYEPAHETQRIQSLESDLQRLKSDKATVQSRMVALREKETAIWDKGAFKGTLAQIAMQHGSMAESHSWLSSHSPEVGSDCPLSNEEASHWLGVLRDEELVAEETLAGQALIDSGSVPTSEDFRALVQLEAESNALAGGFTGAITHEAYERIAALDAQAREELRRRFAAVATAAGALAARHEQWMSQALADVYSGKAELWTRRHTEMTRLLGICRPLLDRVGNSPEVQIISAKTDALRMQAKELQEHLRSGGKLRGIVKPKAVRSATELLENVRVHGRPPQTVDDLQLFIDVASLDSNLKDLEKLWPANVEIPREDTAHERLWWNEAEVGQLAKVIRLGEALRREETHLAELGVPIPDWGDLESVQRYGELVQASVAQDQATSARQPLDEVLERVQIVGRMSNASDAVIRLEKAITSRDEQEYRRSLVEIEHLEDVRRRAVLRDEYSASLRSVAPALVEDVLESVDESHWDRRFGHIEQSWAWAQIGAWIDTQSEESLDLLQRQMKALDDRLQETVGDLTAARAWALAVGRLGARERQSLKSYALAVKQLGKGTGKYAPHKRRQAQRALAECRSAVPAWVMPIYRIADTIEMSSELFDVVIIDEASQAGVEASFLQYLAPRIVVVGDDKQVSPSGVGLEVQQLIDLGKQLIPDLPHAYTWTSPTVSFFDQARLRYGDVITLREHFRCVPEIIGFSNRIAYEPENVPLIPLRQYGLDRLEPIKMVHVENGYTEGRTGNRINPAEVDELVDAVLKCCQDPAYDNKSMGVISLTGRAQADCIEQELLRRLDPREVRARELRCGDAAAFQGSERDVMFLSMVAVRQPNSPLAALTRDTYVQRFNVAASRARDQMWVFHSLALSELNNRDDMRFQLLDYSYGVLSNQGATEGSSTPVPMDVQIAPFESLFEQHVFNRIVERGYTVIPQWKVRGYRIDLVVVGGRSRLAVECDGDQWHGASRYEEDLGRQRELERCGWTFKRIRASEFYRNSHAALESLWELLDARDIVPLHHRQGAQPDAETSVAPAASERTWTEAPEAPPIIESALAPFDEDEATIEPLLEEEQASISEDDSPLTDEHSNDTDQEEDDDSWSELSEVNRTLRAMHLSEDPSRGGTRDADARRRSAKLRPYTSWSTATYLPLPTMATPTQRTEALLRIVEVEGPIIGQRLYQLYVKSSRGSRVGRELARVLNIASHSATGRGLLLADNPLGEAGQQVKTFRLPDQPAVDPRTLGSRTIFEIPPAELAATMDMVRAVGIREAEWFRRVLAAYGLQRLTEPTQNRLRACASLLD